MTPYPSLTLPLGLLETDWTQTLVVPLVTTIVIGVAGILLLLLTLWLLERVTRFSIHKELEEDHNVAVGIMLGSVVIGVSIIIASVVSG